MKYVFASDLEKARAILGPRGLPEGAVLLGTVSEEGCPSAALYSLPSGEFYAGTMEADARLAAPPALVRSELGKKGRAAGSAAQSQAAREAGKTYAGRPKLYARVRTTPIFPELGIAGIDYPSEIYTQRSRFLAAFPSGKKERFDSLDSLLWAYHLAELDLIRE